MKSFEQIRQEAIARRTRTNAYGVRYYIVSGKHIGYGVRFVEDGGSYLVRDNFDTREAAVEWAEAQEFQKSSTSIKGGDYMTASEAQLRANKRYKEKQRKTGRLRFIQVEFNASELDLYEHAKGNRPTAAYIKRLVREDMEKGKR